MNISIQGLSVKTIIGIYPQERETPQEIIFDIDVEFNGDEAAKTDDISKTIDYYQLSEDIAKFVEKTKYLLLERLIEDIAKLIMKNPLAQQCQIKATKPEISCRAKGISLSLKKVR